MKEKVFVKLLKSPNELRKATDYSVRGVMAVVRNEKAFRTDILVFVVSACIAGILCGFSLVSFCETALLVYSAFMVLVAEIVNTAVETTVNRISTEYHELSGRAKDIGSAIVFASFCGMGIVWAIILTGAVLR